MINLVKHGILYACVPAATFVAHEPIKRVIHKVVPQHHRVAKPRPAPRRAAIVSAPACPPLTFERPGIVADEGRIDFASPSRVDEFFGRSPATPSQVPSRGSVMRSPPVVVSTPQKPVSIVPEPSVWAMMVVGFAFIAATIRYRRRRRVQHA